MIYAICMVDYLTLISKGEKFEVLEEFEHKVIINKNGEKVSYSKCNFDFEEVKGNNCENGICDLDYAFENEKVFLHKEICLKLSKIYEQKNADYNDSFAKARKEVQNYTLGKLYDKFERFKQLSKHENQVKSESIEDTLFDLANYAILELIEREIEREKITD